MNLKLLKRKLVSKLPFQNKKQRGVGRFFIPGSNKKLIVIPFTKLSFIPVVVLIALSVYLLYRSDIFLVKNISIHYEGGIINDFEYAHGLIGEQRVREIVEPQVIARSLWSVKSRSVSDLVFSLGPSVLGVEVVKDLPDSLSINVKERIPIALLVYEQIEMTPDNQKIEKKEYYLLDEQGEIFTKINRKVDLPEFSYTALFQHNTTNDEIIGKTIPQNIISELIIVIKELSASQWLTPELFVLIDETLIELKTQDDALVRLSLEKDIQSQLELVNLTFQNAVYGGKKLELVDTRFDKIVVRYI